MADRADSKQAAVTETWRGRERPSRGRVLFVGELPFHRDSNQTLRRTIEHYLTVGFEVVYVTTARRREIVLGHPRYHRRTLDGIYRVGGFRIPWRGRRDSRSASLSFPLASSTIQPMTSILRQVVKLAWFSVVVAVPAYLEARAPETVVIYGYEAFGAPIARLVGALSRKPTVGRFQGTVLHWTKPWRAPLYWFGLALGPRRVVMTNDGTFGDIETARCKRGRFECLFVHNGVDAEEAFANGSPPPGFRKGIDVVWASRQAAWKRPDLALSAWAHLLTHHREAWLAAGRPKLWMFGGGPCVDASRDYVSRLDLIPYVEVIGPAEYPTVQQAIVAARAVLSTNDFSNLTNTVLTALYYRVPVVIRDWGQVRALAPWIESTDASGEQAARGLADGLARVLTFDGRAPAFAAGYLWRDRLRREELFTLRSRKWSDTRAQGQEARVVRAVGGDAA